MIELNENLARDFLAKNSLTDCAIKKVAGDASFRSYYRIFCGEKTFILMFAPPQFEDIYPFVAIDKFLVSHNFSAPKIFAIDEKNGFILLEDLGDDTYGRVLAASLQGELELYEKACDVLLQLHKISAPKDVACYNSALLFREVMLFVDWYIPAQGKKIDLAQKARFRFLWFKLFDLLSKENQVLVLRDYHADNLMVLKNRQTFQSVGLLDFQDAVIGSNAYDLVSLLEDARRDVDEEVRKKIYDYYLIKSSCSSEQFATDYEILSLQRNIKILGIFCRLAMRDNKKTYLDLLPRVRGFVELRLNSENKIFTEISDFLKNFL
jgi:aminoglycoside/choline kinase family phosphotransferase